MRTLAFFDSKPYDRVFMDPAREAYGFKVKYLESRLSLDTVPLATGCDAVVCFVNDRLDAPVIQALHERGIRLIALRCAGFNHVDFKAAYGKVHVVRVPEYSPYAVAEHAMALLLAVNRKIHRAYNRTRDFNFSLSGLTGFDLHGKVAGIVGTGKIGRVFARICSGFGLKVIAYDPYPAKDSGIEYVELGELIRQSDILSLHCPLTPKTHHIIDAEALRQVKPGMVLINTSRGALVDSQALIDAIKEGRVGGAGLDVYEEESEFFFEDFSADVIKDDVLARLVTLPNVILTSHQAFLTREALQNIAQVTMENVHLFFEQNRAPHEVCYRCGKAETCQKKHDELCF